MINKAGCTRLMLNHIQKKTTQEDEDHIFENLDEICENFIVSYNNIKEIKEFSQTNEIDIDALGELLNLHTIKNLAMTSCLILLYYDLCKKYDKEFYTTSYLDERIEKRLKQLYIKNPYHKEIYLYFITREYFHEGSIDEIEKLGGSWSRLFKDHGDDMLEFSSTFYYRYFTIEDLDNYKNQFSHFFDDLENEEYLYSDYPKHILPLIYKIENNNNEIKEEIINQISKSHNATYGSLKTLLIITIIGLILNIIF